MLERTNKRLSLALLLLTTAIVALIWFRSTDSGSVVDPDFYKVSDLKSVDRVVMTSREWKTDLAYNGYRWRVNDQFDADRNLVDVLFATLQQAKPKRPVPSASSDSVFKELRENGVEVSLFSGGEKQLTFFAGGDSDKSTSFFVREKSAEPHVVVIPGYRVYVSGIFELAPLAWREKLIFNFNWQNFSKLTARYRNPAGNFDVTMERNQVSIPGIEADTAKLNTYLDQVSLLTVNEFIGPGPITDSLSNEDPQLRLVIQDIASREYTLEVFAAKDGFYGRVNKELWATLDPNRVFPILRPKDFFARK